MAPSIADEQEKISELRTAREGVVAEREAARAERDAVKTRLSQAIERREAAKKRWELGQDDQTFKEYKAAMDAVRREQRAVDRAQAAVKAKTRRKEAFDAKVARQERIAMKKTGEAPVKMRTIDPDAGRATYNPVTDTYTRKDRVPPPTVSTASVRTPSALTSKAPTTTTTKTLTASGEQKIAGTIKPAKRVIEPAKKRRGLAGLQTTIRQKASKADPLTATGLGVASVGVGLAQLGVGLVTKPGQTLDAIIDPFFKPKQTIQKAGSFAKTTISDVKAGRSTGFFNVGQVAGEAALIKGVKIKGRPKPVVEITTPKGKVTATRSPTGGAVFEEIPGPKPSKTFIEGTSKELSQINPPVERPTAQGVVVTAEAGEQVAANLRLREFRKREAAKTAAEGRGPEAVIKNLVETRKKATEQAMKESDVRRTIKEQPKRTNEFIETKKPKRSERAVDEPPTKSGGGTAQEAITIQKTKTKSKTKAKAKQSTKTTPKERAFIDIKLKQKPGRAFRLRGASKEGGATAGSIAGVAKPATATPTKPLFGPASKAETGAKTGAGDVAKPLARVTSGLLSGIRTGTAVGTGVAVGAAAFALPKPRSFKPLKTKKPPRIETGGSRTSRSKRSSKGKQKFKFKPSITGVFKGIKERRKKKTGFSGLELRGI